MKICALFPFISSVAATRVIVQPLIRKELYAILFMIS